MAGILIFLSSLSLFFLLLFELRLRRLSAFFSSMLFVFVLIPHFYFLYNPNYVESVMENASLFLAAFLFLYVLSRFLFILMSPAVIKHGSRASFETGVDIGKVIFFYYVMLTLGCLSFSYALVGFSFYELFFIDWWSVVNSGSVFANIGSYFLYAGGSALVFSKIANKKLFTFFVFFVLLFGVFVLKTRGYVLVFLFPLIFYMVMFHAAPVSRKAAGALFFLVAGVVLLIFVRMIRQAGSLSEIDFMLFSELFQTSTGDGAEAGLIDGFYYFISHDNAFYGFGVGDTFKRVLFFFIPTDFWGIKPPDFSYKMYCAYYGNCGESLSMHPTIVGDAFANFGYSGFFLGGVYALVFSFVDYVMEKIKATDFNLYLMLLAPVFLLFVYVARGSVYNGFVFFLGSSLLVFLNYLFLKNK